VSNQKVLFEDLRVTPYQQAWDYQEELLRQNVSRKAIARAQEVNMGEPGTTLEISSTHHHFLLVEHPPVYTLGKSGDINNVLLSEERLKARGIDFFRTNRGGDITFHGPGQIVGYPILDLEKFYTDIGRYLRNLEEVIIGALSEYGIDAGRSPGETGVWIDPEVKGREDLRDRGTQQPMDHHAWICIEY
jgi:lipoyl(octanoyl) transferase